MNPPPISTPPPLPQSPQMLAENSTSTQVICWLIIIACVSLVFFSNHYRKSMPKEDADKPAAQLQMETRMAVGWVEITRSFSGGKVDAKLVQQMTAPLRDKAKNAVDKLHAAIVIGDLESTEAAKSLLEEVAAGADEKLAADAERVLAAHAGQSLSETEAGEFKDRHGWTGELVSVHGRAANDAARAEVLRPAKRTAVVFMIFFAVLVLALVLGFGLFITAIVLICMKHLRFAGVPTAGFDPRILESFAAYMTITCSAIAWGMLKLPGGRVASLLAMAGSVVIAYMWPRWRGMSKSERAAALGISRGQGVIWEIGCGIVGYVALLPIVAAAFIVTVILTKQFNTDSGHPISEMITAPLWIFLLVAAMAVIYAPITEELFFRGAFFGFLRTRIFWPIAAIVVGFIFAAIHPQGWAAIPLLAAIGVNLAILRHWRGSLIAPITAHALNNGTVMLMMALALR